MKYRAVLLALVGVLTGCATGSGDLFETVVRAEGGTSESSTTTTSENEENSPVLEVESTPDDAEVYLNGAFVGETPLELEDIEPGNYLLRIKRRGYYEYEDWIEIENHRSYSVSVSLEQVTGYLTVASNVPEIDVTVNGLSIGSDISELPIGSYRLIGRAFGYEPAEQRIVIRENVTTRVYVELEPAAFKIAEPLLTRARFAPSNPGVLGTTVIRFEVTAPGTGTVLVSDENGRSVRTESIGPFDTWQQRWEWDGTTDSGDLVEDGRYQIQIEGSSSWIDAFTVDTAVIEVTVDSSAVIRYYGSLGSTVGTVFATAPRVLPPGSLQISALMTGHRNTTTFGLLGRYPIGATLRVGLPANIEAVLGGIAILYSESSYVRRLLSMSVRTELSNAPLATGVGARGTIFNRSTDGRWNTADSFASYLGGGLFVPLSVTYGSFEIIVTPELAVSPVLVSYGDDAVETGFYVWSYLRTGVRFDRGTFQAAASAAIRTLPFSQGVGIDTPINVGIESHLMIPNTPIYLSAVLTSEIDPGEGYYISGGGGIGLIY